MVRRSTRSDLVDERDPPDLLRRYRGLCEATGLARAHRMPLASNLADELAAIEARLLELLRLPDERSQIGDLIADAAKSDTKSARSAVPSLVLGAAPSVPANGEKIVRAEEEGEVLRPSSPSPVAPSTDRAVVATVFTDGSAEGNPGPGGYCAIVRIPGLPDRELSGGTNHSTNNKMELTAAIVGLRAALDAGATKVSVVTDSEYLVRGMTRWLSGWQAKGWKTADGQPVKNRDLWEQLAGLAQRGSVSWQWIRGHAGHLENERCDAVATAAARKAAERS